MIKTYTNALNAFTLRAPEGCAAISLIITRLLRHFIPRNDTLPNAFVLINKKLNKKRRKNDSQHLGTHVHRRFRLLQMF
jgi:hypothetical protein